MDLLRIRVPMDDLQTRNQLVEDKHPRTRSRTPLHLSPLLCIGGGDSLLCRGTSVRHGSVEFGCRPDDRRPRPPATPPTVCLIVLGVKGPEEVSGRSTPGPWRRSGTRRRAGTCGGTPSWASVASSIWSSSGNRYSSRGHTGSSTTRLYFHPQNGPNIGSRHLPRVETPV